MSLRHCLTDCPLAAAVLCLCTGVVAARDMQPLGPVDPRMERVEMTLRPGSYPGTALPQPSSQGSCPPVIATHTDATFEGGSFIVQAGFAETEIAAASYTLDAAVFPLKVEMMEMIFATSNTNVTTTTHWSILVWEGTPASGTLVAEYSSDDVILPHLVIPPGTNGVNVQVIVDPGDPEPIIIQDDGTATFSIGYRIDQHNNQTGNPCLTAPPSSANAFPTTDTSGLASPTGNWLYGVNCGPLGCPANGGWSTFAGLGFGCQPSGDWVMRATWKSFSCSDIPGACCVGGECVDGVTETDCTTLGGTWQGSIECNAADCSQEGACCIASTGGCLHLSPADCALVGGIFQGLDTDCDTITCFPVGACCLANGSCMDGTSPDNCAALGGTFQGDTTACAAISCPEPEGACCLVNGSCIALSASDCAIVAGSWAGINTDCNDENGNGQADSCESTCAADLDSDGEVGFPDLLQLLSLWGPCTDCQEDLDGNGEIAFADLLSLLSSWGPC